MKGAVSCTGYPWLPTGSTRAHTEQVIRVPRQKGSINLGLDFKRWVKNKHYFIFDKNTKFLLATAYLNNLSQYEQIVS